MHAINNVKGEICAVLQGLCARSLSSGLGQHIVLEESVLNEGLLLKMGRKWRDLWTMAMVLSLCWFDRLSFCLMAAVIRVPLFCCASPSLMN